MTSGMERSGQGDPPSSASKPFPEDPRIVSRLHFGGGCAHGALPSGETAAGPLDRGVAVVLCTYQRPESLERCLASLEEGGRGPDALVIVDASLDDATERAIARIASSRAPTRCCLYFRVTGSLRGLTRQRNFAMRWVAHDLVAFFDDDVVLLPGCLSEMEKTHRELGEGVVGVGARIDNEPTEPSRLWRLRRAIGIVPSLAPGRYFRSGMSTPWEFADDSVARPEGDWLPGCAMMWKTVAARELGFPEEFAGYAQGEDLDFSLRARARGRLVLARAARVLHLQEAAGRPDHFRMGYMAIRNRFRIHQRAFGNRRWIDVAWFIYAWTADTLLLGRHLFFPRRWASTRKHVAGRLKAAADLAFQRRSKGEP